MVGFGGFKESGVIYVFFLLAGSWFLLSSWFLLR
jgi:hypothetical protein